MRFKIFIFVMVFLIPFISSAVIIENQTITFSSVSNSTIRFEQNTTIDQLTVTDQATEIYGISTTGAKFTSINLTYGGKLNFYNLNDDRIVYDNGTIFNAISGDHNFTLDAGGQYLIYYTTSTSSDSGDIETTSGSGILYLSSEKLKKGYNITARKSQQFILGFESGDKTFKVLGVTENNISFYIYNKSYSMKVGEVKKIDLDDDGFYDFQVFLISSNGVLANVELKEIREKVFVEDEEVEDIEKQQDGFFSKKNIILIAIVLLIFVGYYLLKRFKKRKKNAL